MKDRIYVCHTYYHVYVTFLKEFKIRRSGAGSEKSGEAVLVLSRMSNNFENLKQRIEKTGLFSGVIEFDEKRDDFFPELKKYREDRGNIVFNMISRIFFTKKYAELEEKYIPVDFREYKDIYVFCDSDPIGYYLNQKKIYYHAVEDGLNCIKNFDAARFENRGHFKLKAFLSKKFNLIFVQNGYGKYCLDMEVNDISLIHLPCPYYIEEPRQPLVDALSRKDKDILLEAFVRNRKELEKQVEENRNGSMIMILTEPLCSLEVRKQIFRDLVEKYEREGTVIIKPHPRDALDYKKLFPELTVIDATVPMEMLNFFENFRCKKIVSVFTEMKGVKFADEIVALGADFMDRYEEPSIHRQNEQIS